MAMNEEEATVLISEVVQKILTQSTLSNGRISELLSSYGDIYDVFALLYKPDEKLGAVIAEYQQWYSNLVSAKTAKDNIRIKELENSGGELMEELAFLAFNCMQGRESIKSFPSYSAQHDLIVSGSAPIWCRLIEHLHLPLISRTIVIEAKNTQDPVSDSQFSRLCSIVQNKLETACALGVFFSRSGATGFPQSGQNGRQRSLRDSRATQIIFHARTRKFVVVLNHEDILRLNEPGALPRILEAKVRDVEEASGLSLEFIGNWTEIDLPPHLKKHLS